MLLQLGRSLPAPHREAILSSCKELGYAVRFLDEEQRLLQLEGPGAPGHRARLTDLTGVVRVVDKGESHELALRNGDHAEDSMIPVGNARFGAGNLSLIAGPCAVEDEERLEEIARGVLRTGAWLLRAGAFKPRTSPYSFQGIGVEGLDILDRVKASTGIGVEGPQAVTVLSSDGTTSDALATAISVLDRESSERLLEAFPGCAAMWVTEGTKGIRIDGEAPFPWRIFRR